jgi:hypothetical protein
MFRTHLPLLLALALLGALGLSVTTAGGAGVAPSAAEAPMTPEVHESEDEVMSMRLPAERGRPATAKRRGNGPGNGPDRGAPPVPPPER